MILDDISAASYKRVELSKTRISTKSMYENAINCEITNEYRFEKALSRDGLSFICEVKKGSPSKGIISKDFPYIEIAKNYEKINADAISVLTEPDFFKGSNKYLTEISHAVKTPLLRKDFIVDEYQIYEAKVIGASAILLICAILPPARLNDYFKIAKELGLSVLVESHNEKELDIALNSGARIIGVNNRDLTNFTVDIKTSERLRKYVPNDKIFVSESGLKTAEDINKVREYGADAVLIGEAFMRSKNVGKLMDNFRK